MDPSGSFFRSVIGFLVFIGISFGLTYAINSYAQTHEKQVAAVEAVVNRLLGL